MGLKCLVDVGGILVGNMTHKMVSDFYQPSLAVSWGRMSARFKSTNISQQKLPRIIVK